ncbi:hypothetical protein KRR55_06360 [Paeniglutamicibacter sp. ABSL32-1]|uniref:hypothetical protein n=1 Tax=Paeniglutamicibacter quisquiliarum TaxID=2849498 RepID=UPI001C2D71C5|nr:hypothetical protein [Paeniglutamicibacter quisquiliarum]MBV1778734.1 hypothetical protein [Paeniglutamicibacter quisquiliarum]
MNEQPGNDNPAGDDEADLGTVSFFRVSGGTQNGLPYLSSLTFDFDDGTPDPEEGESALAAAITGLNDALLDYRLKLASRAADFGQAFAPATGDAELLAASDRVHDALESLGMAHRAYTGHPFRESPLHRLEPVDPEQLAAMLEAEELARDREQEAAFGPRLDELGATVVLDKMLHHGDREVLHLATATVHSTGVLLVFDYLNLRGSQEDAATWHRRSHEHLGNVELGVELVDAATGTSYPAGMHGGEGNIERNCYRLVHRFWIDRALDAEALTGTVTVQDALAADGTMEPLAVALEIDCALLREATTRIRTPGSKGQ